MPTYEYFCKKCNKTVDVLHTIAEINNPTDETIKEITCDKHGRMIRLISTPHLANMKGGATVTEKQLLREKQQQLKIRAREASAQQIESEVKNEDDKARLRKKYSSEKYKNLKNNPYAKK